ncbi:MAG TPA: hypothetical protein VNY04_11220 [Chthoniobacterales bacterium]|jgi:hypothetical protein|nr:hypothetical protein [Chthoniobacterales bacterium]
MKTVNPSNNEKLLTDRIAACNFELPLNFKEIAELSERCEPIYRKIRATNSFTPPLTFVVPAYQLVASISRFVE